LDLAKWNFDQALQLAHSISHHPLILDATLRHGYFYARYLGDYIGAFSHLIAALDYAAQGGYRIYEADVRVALAWAYLANDEKEKAKQSARHALQMSTRWAITGESWMQKKFWRE
jgi:hypothetical protein